MHYKKIIAKGLIISILLLNTPIDSTASTKDNSFKEFFNNIFSEKPKKENLNINNNVKVGSTYEITLNDGEFIPDLTANPGVYETIIVTTTGNKKLVDRDYINLKKSGIPNIDLSQSVSDYIPYDAFSGSTLLKTFKFPQNIMYIEDNAFNECSSLTGDLVIPNSVTSIGNNAFRNCNNLNGTLTLSNSLTKIGNTAFRGCNKLNGTLVIPNSVTTIGREAFSACSSFTGELVIPPSVTRIDDKAFADCRGLSGNLLIPDTLKTLGFGVFDNCVNVNKFSIKVNSSDASSDYKRDLCFKLPDTSQSVIDIPYDFNIEGTWMATTITNRIIGKPTIKNIIDGQETELEGSVGKNISLYIPAPYKEQNISVLKDGKSYNLPNKNDDNKYIFTEEGVYSVTIITDLGNTSVIDFEIESKTLENAQIAIEQAISSKNPNDIENARDLVNKLPESSKKDEFQGILDSIFPKIEIETKNITSNFDIYIESSNILGLSLNTSMITFEDFSGVEDIERLNAITLTVDSSLPYELNAYLPNEIVGSNYKEAMDKEILNIRESNQSNYSYFTDINTKLTLKDNNDAGDDISHRIDLKLKGNIPHKKDIYKAIIKLEIQQK